jgi:selenide,water dikinase
MKPRAPATKHLVLVGGGHAHALVARMLGMDPIPGVDVTLIAKELDAPYSGMLPGLVAGHYRHDDCHIDLVRLAAWCDIRLLHGEVTGVDRISRQVQIKGRPPLGYDLLSIDVGITPSLDGIAGAAEHAIAVKPVNTFAPRWKALEADALRKDGPRRIAVVGSGAAGFELVLSARHALLGKAPAAGIDLDAFSFTLAGGAMLLPSHNAGARRHAHAALARDGIALIEGDPVIAVDAGGMTLASGRMVGADAVMVTTKAAPPAWLAATDLPRDPGGYLAVRPTLQLLDDDDVFAVGDCATVLEHPREKAGVFAVRQGPPLTANLRLRAEGKPALPFVPQRQFLTLLSTGSKHAIAARGPFSLAGNWVWRWKDRIDREFMERFSDLPPRAAMSSPSAPMRCMGCAAKIGPAPLAAALDRLSGLRTTEASGGGPSAFRQGGGGAGRPARDDAAVVDEGGPDLRLETVDFFPAFWPEPYVLGEIAARHAMGDIFAMGGQPERAHAIVTLPEAGARRTEEDLFQLLAGARAAFDDEGVELIGGHTSEGAVLSIGFHVSGRVARDRLLRKGGLREGDALILTRPIGTGIALAALNQGLGRTHVLAPILETMRRSSREAAVTLAAYGAHAMTDVTGFGLAGHLSEMLEASQRTAMIEMAVVPVFDGVYELARSGIASTLVPANLTFSDRLAGELDNSTLALLFDPQTAGGLLAGIPAERAVACVQALREAGATEATIIGRVGGASVKGTPLLVIAK